MFFANIYKIRNSQCRGNPVEKEETKTGKSINVKPSTTAALNEQYLPDSIIDFNYSGLTIRKEQ